MTELSNFTPKGTCLKIFTFPSTVLKKKSINVTSFDDELENLCNDMLYTMYHAPGIGLAAPQIGKNIRLFVIDINYNRETTTKSDGEEEIVMSDFNPQIFINPKIISKEGEQIYEEGCLSVPGVFEEVKRANKIEVEYQNVKGEKHKISADGTLAVCLQHENDHLDGIVFLDRISLIKRNLIKKRILKEIKLSKE